MKFLLEYSEKQHCFHLNYKETTGEFHNELFANGYRPITIIDEDAIESDTVLEGTMNRICREHGTYEEAARDILFLMLTPNSK